MVLAVALGAAIGAALRYLAGHAWDGRMPWGTVAVNVVGSFLLGGLSGLALASEGAWAFAATGLCGGLTTYSAFAVHAHDRGPRLGTLVVLATVPAALAACSAGFVLGAAVSGG